MENNKRKYTAIYRWTMKRYIPVSIAYWVLLFLVLPMEELFVLVTTTLVPDGTLDDYLEAIREPQFFLIITMIIVVFFSTIISFIAFSYMHNKRCVDFFGSLPVSRRTMFFSRYLGVITLVVIPLLIDGIIGGILTLSFMGFLEMMGYMLLIILAAVGNVTMIAFISLCSGTISDMVISYLALNVAYPICIAICSLFPMSVVPGVSYSLIPANIFTFFTPIAAPFTGIFSNQKWIFIVWWIVISAVIIFGCYMLCKKRKAETAQNSSTFAVLSNVVKFIVCFAAGFGFGWILSFMGNNFRSITAQYVWFFIGLVIGVMVANILLHLVFYKGMNHYNKSMILCAAVIVAAGGFLFFVTTGMFGYDSYVPKESEVASVYVGNDENKFMVDGKNILQSYSSSKDDIEDVLSVHQEIVAESLNITAGNYKGNIYPINDGYATYDYVGEPNDVSFEAVDISYKLKNGKIINRHYDAMRLKTTIKVRGLIERFISSRNAYANISDEYVSSEVGVGTISKNYSYDNDGDYDETYITLSEGDLKQLLSAINEDYREHGAVDGVEYYGNTYKLSKEKKEGYTIGLEYDSPEDDFDFGTVYVYWAVDETYTRTIRLMKKLHMTNPDYMEVSTYFEEGMIDTTNKTRTIYFTMPSDWEKDTDIRAAAMNLGEALLYSKLDSDITKCEKVSDNVWKYELPISNKDDYYAINAVVFYQVLEEHMNCTGTISVPKDTNKNMLKLKSKIKGRTLSDDFPSSLYDPEWIPYNN